MVSAELTTVRVVAPDTPSAVGGASNPSNVAITQSAVVLERLIGQFLFSKAQEEPAAKEPAKEPAKAPAKK